jgi:hypothetical protein
MIYHYLPYSGTEILGRFGRINSHGWFQAVMFRSEVPWDADSLVFQSSTAGGIGIFPFLPRIWVNRHRNKFLVDPNLQ